MTDALPFNELKDVHEFAIVLHVIKGNLPMRPTGPATIHGLTDGLWQLIQSCWSEPEIRPSVDEVRKETWKLRSVTVIILIFSAFNSTETYSELWSKYEGKDEA